MTNKHQLFKKFSIFLYFFCLEQALAMDKDLSLERGNHPLPKLFNIAQQEVIYEDSIISLKKQDFFRSPMGFVNIIFDVREPGLAKYLASSCFELVKKGKKPLFSAFNVFRLQNVGTNKLGLSIPLLNEEDNGEYDLHMSSSLSLNYPENNSPEKLCTITVKTQPKSIGEVLRNIRHYKTQEMNKGLDQYKKVYGNKWSTITLPNSCPNMEDSRYILDTILGQGQDGTILKMIPADNSGGEPIVLKVWRDLSPYNFEDLDDTLKINNEITTRRIFPPDIIVPLLYNEELKISGVRALIMPFINGETLEQILSRKDLLPTVAYEKIIGQLQEARPLLEQIDDLNSSNILINSENEIKLIDFSKGFRRNNFDKGEDRFNYFIKELKNKIRGHSENQEAPSS